MKVFRTTRQAYVFAGIFLLIASIIMSNVWRRARANYISMHQIHAVFNNEKNFDLNLLYPVSTENEESSSVLAITGWAHFIQGNTQKAIDNLSQASHLDPDRVTTIALLGDAYFKEGDIEDAVYAWEKAGAEFRLYNNALIAHREERWPEAIQYLLMSIQVDPESASKVYSLLGDDYRYMGQRNEAATAYRKAASLEPNSYQAAMHEALAALTLTEWEEAISWYRHARLINPDKAEPYYQEGHIWYWEKGEKEKSLSLIKHASELDPNNPIPYIKMIQIYSIENEFERADFWFRESESIIPDNISIMYYEALSQMRQGAYFEAVALADRILEQSGEYHLAWYLRGNAYMSLSRPSDAVFSYEKAVEFSPNDPNYRVHLAQALLDVENPCRALKEANQVLSINMDYMDEVEVIRSKAGPLCNPQD